MNPTIETPNGTLVAVQVIFDRDHGQENEGWYIRTRYADGHDEDDPIDFDADETDQALRSFAFSFVFPPDGLNDDQMDTLWSMIEVRR